MVFERADGLADEEREIRLCGVFDDEGHGFRKRVNRIEASEAYLQFLDTYLRAMP